MPGGIKRPPEGVTHDGLIDHAHRPTNYGMPDNSFNVVNASGCMLDGALSAIRSLDGEGASCDEARRMLTDISMTATLLELAISKLDNITESFVGSRQLPQAKVQQALRDMNELKTGLKLTKSAAFAASRALCFDLDHGIPAPAVATTTKATSAKTTSQKPA